MNGSRMPDGKATELREFVISIEWHEKKRPETITVIARGLADAQEIGRMLFIQFRPEAAVIEDVKGAEIAPGSQNANARILR